MSPLPGLLESRLATNRFKDVSAHTEFGQCRLKRLSAVLQRLFFFRSGKVVSGLIFWISHKTERTGKVIVWKICDAAKHDQYLRIALRFKIWLLTSWSPQKANPQVLAVVASTPRPERARGVGLTERCWTAAHFGNAKYLVIVTLALYLQYICTANMPAKRIVPNTIITQYHTSDCVDDGFGA